MKAKWCTVCAKLILYKYKRCPKCSSTTIQDAETRMLLLERSLESADRKLRTIKDIVR